MDVAELVDEMVLDRCVRGDSETVGRPGDGVYCLRAGSVVCCSCSAEGRSR